MQQEIATRRRVRVRPAARRDLAAIVRMIASLAAHHGDTARIAADTLERDGFGARRWIDLFVADAGSGPVGFAMAHRWYRGAEGQRGFELHHLYVDPGHRGTGVGRRLIEAVLAHARSRGCALVTIGTAPGNTAAQAIYRHLGFQPSPPPGPRFRMALSGGSCPGVP